VTLFAASPGKSALPLREDKNLTDLYESYTKPQPEVYRTEKPKTELEAGEQLMKDKTTGKTYIINREAGTYREVK